MAKYNPKDKFTGGQNQDFEPWSVQTNESKSDVLTIENFEVKKTYSDYPQSATNNAKRALKWKKENGSSCGTSVGWKRASQLANRQALSRDTIARMASFKRHQQHKDVPYSEGCGGIMWDAWGGSAGVNWAISKLKQIDKEKKDLKFDPNQARDERGRWTDMIGGTDEADPNRDKTKSHSIDVANVLTLHDEFGGSSFAMNGENQVGKPGAFSVSIFPEASQKIPGKFITSEQYNNFIEKYSDLIENSEYPTIMGTWYDTDDDVTWLDVSVVVDRDTAFNLAELYNQKAIFDLENLEEIDTGGTGEVIKNYVKNLYMKNDDKKPKADTGKVTPEQYRKFAKNWARYNKNRKK